MVQWIAGYALVLSISVAVRIFTTCYTCLPDTVTAVVLTTRRCVSGVNTAIDGTANVYAASGGWRRLYFPLTGNCQD